MNLREETLKCFRPDPERSGRFLLTEPHLLYLSDEQSVSYLQAKKTDYGDGFHKDIMDIVGENISRFLPEDNQTFSLIDLGPGYPDKTLPMLKKAYESGLNINYIPVDVSAHYLGISAESVKREVSSEVSIYPIRAPFEVCGKSIKKPLYDGHVLVFLGPTYMNFPSYEIGKTLKRIARDRGEVAVCSELISNDNPISKIMAQYNTKEAAEFVGGVIKNLGEDPQKMKFFLDFDSATGAINMGFSLKRNLSVGEHDLKKGDQIVTAVTHRYTLDQFVHNLESVFSNVEVMLSKNSRTALALARG